MYDIIVKNKIDKTIANDENNFEGTGMSARDIAHLTVDDMAKMSLYDD